jgi:hypothetical protein
VHVVQHVFNFDQLHTKRVVAQIKAVLTQHQVSFPARALKLQLNQLLSNLGGHNQFVPAQTNSNQIPCSITDIQPNRQGVSAISDSQLPNQPCAQEDVTSP